MRRVWTRTMFTSACRWSRRRHCAPHDPKSPCAGIRSWGCTTRWGSNRARARAARHRGMPGPLAGAAGLANGFGEQPRLRSNEDLSHHLTGTRICSAPESAVKPKASGQDSESTARREPGGDRATATHSERCRCLPIGQQHPKESVSKISRIRVIGQERTHQTTQAAGPQRGSPRLRFRP